MLKKNRITKSSSRFHKRNLQDGDLETFLKESLINFKNRNELYQKTDPTGKESDTDKQGIIYESTKSLRYKNQFLNDIIMVYKTLYPENSYAKEFFKIE